jgi:hypothetical protein
MPRRAAGIVGVRGGRGTAARMSAGKPPGRTGVKARRAASHRRRVVRSPQRPRPRASSGLRTRAQAIRASRDEPLPRSPRRPLPAPARCSVRIRMEAPIMSFASRSTAPHPRLRRRRPSPARSGARMRRAETTSIAFRGASLHRSLHRRPPPPARISGPQLQRRRETRNLELPVSSKSGLPRLPAMAIAARPPGKLPRRSAAHPHHERTPAIRRRAWRTAMDTAMAVSVVAVTVATEAAEAARSASS